MRKITALYTMLVGAIFLASLVAVPVASAVDAENYDANDGWAVGQTISLDWNWDDMPAEAKQGLSTLLAYIGYELDNLDVDLEAAFYAYLTVDEVKAEEYIMSAKMALKLKADANVAVTGEMLKAGKYEFVTAEVFQDPTYYDLWYVDYEEDLGIATESTSMSLDLGMDFALIVGGTIVMEKETLAIKSMGLSLKAAAVIDFKANNIQTTESNLDEIDGMTVPEKILVNVTNNNYDVKVKASIDASLNVVFDPALNIYEFPMAMGSEWTIDSTATINGEMKGFVDITGLPEEIEEELFSEEGILYLAGFTGFPLVFDDFESDGIVIKDGKLEELTIDITADAVVEGTRSIDGRTVYEITAYSEEGQFEYLYSPVLLDLLSFSGIPDLEDELGFDLEDLAALGVTISDDEPTVEKAKNEIKAIESYHSSVDKKANGSSSLFGDLDMMVVLGAVIVVAVIGGGALFLIRLMRK